MKIIETNRLIIRKFKEDDFSAVHSYASVLENIVYMEWGPNTEEQTKWFLNFAINKTAEEPITGYQLAVVLKESNKLVGACDLNVKDDTGELGWILHRDYWKQGYGTEIGKALLKFGFETLNLHRITARCDAENYGSYKVMENIGMRKEALFVKARNANKNSNDKYSDELVYAMLESEYRSL